MSDRPRSQHDLNQGEPVEYLMRIQDVAKYFDVTVHTVQTWMKQGKITFYRTPHPDGLDKEVPASQRRTTLYTTKEQLKRCAEWRFKLQ